MTRRVVWRREAGQDVGDAAVFIADDNPSAAVRFLDAVDETIQDLLYMPGLGRTRTFRRPQLSGIRSKAVRGFANYLVSYRPIEDGIEVIRVPHGARDIRALLDAEDP